MTAIALLNSTAQAGVNTCEEQNPCVAFSVTKQDSSACEDGWGCYYKVCLEATYGGDCSKGVTISHTCEKQENLCVTESGFELADETTSIGDGYVYCQTIPVNGTAEFLLKDANGNCGTDAKLFGEFTAACEGYTEDSCKGNVDKECVWRIDVADSCNAVDGAAVDPHIKCWNRKTFDFRGECDLVLVHSDHVNGEDELDIHFRTTIYKHWSSTTSAALRVGEVILQMDLETFYLDGVEHNDADLPIQTDQFIIKEPLYGHNERLYIVELDDKSIIKFKIVKNMIISVGMSGHAEDFERSYGLLGDYWLGKPYGRNGQRVYDFNEYGLEWQVREDEPKLFIENCEPQLPRAKCVFPEEARPSRHLKSVENPEHFGQAQKACAQTNHFENCVDDVMYTGDVAHASAFDLF